jgi:uncharacterized protein YciI
MKAFPFFVLGIVTVVWACTQDTDNQEQNTQTVEASPTYDSLLARELGADAYGMKTYVMAFLKEGPDRTQDSTTAAAIQRGHLDNITRMAKEGKLIFAGPFMDSFEIKGIYIFDVETIEEAEELTNTDPAIQSGRLTMELHPFYGSAALMKVNEIHEKIQKQGI